MVLLSDHQPIPSSRPFARTGKCLQFKFGHPESAPMTTGLVWDDLEADAEPRGTKAVGDGGDPPSVRF